MPHVNSGGSDDFFSNDEVKSYKYEGEDEKKSSENLSEDKLGLVTETEEVSMHDSIPNVSHVKRVTILRMQLTKPLKFVFMLCERAHA